jgi:hypothetical protein
MRTILLSLTVAVVAIAAQWASPAHAQAATMTAIGLAESGGRQYQRPPRTDLRLRTVTHGGGRGSTTSPAAGARSKGSTSRGAPPPVVPLRRAWCQYQQKVFASAGDQTDLASSRHPAQAGNG